MIWMDSTTYHFGQDLDRDAIVLRATITNRLSYPLYLLPCGTSALDGLIKRSGNEWEPAYAPVCPLRGEVPIMVAPGKSFRDTHRVRLSAGRLPEFSVDSLGDEYRAIYRVMQKSGDPNSALPPGPDALRFLVPAPEHATTSPSFRLEGPP